MQTAAKPFCVGPAAARLPANRPRLRRAARVLSFKEDNGSVPTVKVAFKFPHQTRFGENVAVVGSFTGWDPTKPLKLEWSEGNVWQGDAEVPAGSDILEYKYILTHEGSTNVTWQPGGNLVLQLGEGTQALLVLDDWLGTEHVVEPADVAELAVAMEEEALPAPEPEAVLVVDEGVVELEPTSESKPVTEPPAPEVEAALVVEEPAASFVFEEVLAVVEAEVEEEEEELSAEVALAEAVALVDEVLAEDPTVAVKEAVAAVEEPAAAEEPEPMEAGHTTVDATYVAQAEAQEAEMAEGALPVIMEAEAAEEQEDALAGEAEARAAVTIVKWLLAGTEASLVADKLSVEDLAAAMELLGGAEAAAAAAEEEAVPVAEAIEAAGEEVMEEPAEKAEEEAVIGAEEPEPEPVLAAAAVEQDVVRATVITELLNGNSAVYGDPAVVVGEAVEEQEEGLELPPRPKDAVSPALAILEDGETEEMAPAGSIFSSWMSFFTGKK